MAFIDPPTRTPTTPSGLVGENPCLDCLSESQLIAVIVGLLANGASKTVAEVQSDGACFTCLSRKQMLVALVVKLADDLLTGDDSVQDIIDNYHCLVCVDEKRLLAQALQLYVANYTLGLTAE